MDQSSVTRKIERRFQNSAKYPMPLYMTREETRLVISGNTFEAKEAIKELGGRWDAPRRIWTLPLEMDTEETRTRLGAIKPPLVLSEDERRAAAAEKEQKRRAAAAAKNRELVQSCLADKSGKYWWVCCDKCEIVDFKKGHTSCRAHAHWDGQSWCSFRIFGSLYTGN